MEIVPQKTYSPGGCLVNGGYPVEALPFLEREIIEHEHFSTWNNLGLCHKWMGNYDKALAAFKRTLEMMPGAISTHHNIALAHEEMGNFEAAIKGYATATSWTSEANMQFGLASALLREKKFEQAMPLWEIARLGKRSCGYLPNLEVWRGQHLFGKSILVSREGGFGDIFWQLRYLKLLRDMGAHVVLQVNERQVEILTGHPWVDRVIPDKQPLNPQDYDYQVPMWSLMWEFRKLGVPVPLGMDEPYIKATRKETFDSPAVGIGWEAGEITSIHRPMRAIQEEYLDEFAKVNVNWYSLIPGKQPAWCKGVCPLGWKQTAEFIAGLDLVISADTSIAHLSGAMGLPTWVFLPAGSAWLYFRETETCEWYPSMRLFRNREPVSFKPVVERLVEELGKWVADRALWREEVLA